jgi:hypothetical protein
MGDRSPVLRSLEQRASILGRCATSPPRPPFRTTQLGKRDKRAARRLMSPKPTVSGSESKDPNHQNPTESREFLSLILDA